jgi:hydrogenase expression/formation protein HypE
MTIQPQEREQPRERGAQGERDQQRGSQRTSAREPRHAENSQTPREVAPACPAPHPHHDRIVLGHGSGGRLTNDLIQRLFYPLLENATLLAGDDAAVMPAAELLEQDLAVSVDSHVVHPLFFPGGDIGHLSVCGTVNDLCMVGARPLWIAAGFILEEGFPREALERIVRSVRAAADEAGVTVVAGDTKVAERGKVDGVYITTTGVGAVPPSRRTRGANVQPGDAVLLNGTLGDHGIAVLAARGELAFQTAIESDTAPLNHLVERMYSTGAAIHAMRDPTRGGLAASLNELAQQSEVTIVLDEKAIPVRPEVEAACEMLGFDPMHVANEGKLVAFVPQAEAGAVLAAMRENSYGRDACLIGRVEAGPEPRVLLETGIGGTRIVDTPAGELLPRIC